MCFKSLRKNLLANFVDIVFLKMEEDIRQKDEQKAADDERNVELTEKISELEGETEKVDAI